MSKTHQTLSDHAKTPGLPGFVAMASHKGQICFSGAYGQRGPDLAVPMATDQVFYIASMTKAITTMAALQLVEQGKVDLDQDPGTVLDDLAAPKVLTGFNEDKTPILRPAKASITLRHLLSHTSGFGYDMWNPDLAQYVAVSGTPGIGTGLKAALRLPLAFDPGTAWEYGIGIDWAGQVVEAVSGKTLDVYCRDHITTPLGMTDTAFLPHSAMQPRLAGMAARGCNCRRDATGGDNVVVLDQDSVIEPEAMVEAATATHGVFLEGARAWRRLACTDHACLCAADLLNQSVCSGSHADRKSTRLNSSHSSVSRMPSSA